MGIFILMNSGIKMFRISVITLFMLVGFQLAYSQSTPIVSGVDKTTGTVDEEVTISGLNFPTTNLEVRFGTAESLNIISATSNLIVAEVPPGATYGPISVTDKTSGLTGYSSQHFLLSFSGASGSSTLGTQVQEAAANNAPFDLTVANFDGDAAGLMDIVKTNDEDVVFDIYRNTSTPGAISFSRSTSGTTATRNADAADLDGDGLPDLIMSRGNNADVVFMLENTSTVGAISFGAGQNITLPKIGDLIRIARRPVVHDLDRDGKPDLIVSNETDNIIYVYKNQSTVGNISFNTTPVELVATGATVGISGLDVKDLNNDGFPEVIANPLIGSSNIFVFRNLSSPGTISIQAATVITGPSGLVNLVAGDFDGDGFNDVASTSGSNNAVIIFRNTTTQAGDAITLDAPSTVPTGRLAPNGIALGDIDGDGRVDVAVGHEDQTNPAIVLLMNTSTSGSISFSAVVKATAKNSRNVKIADLDNDGRPDISFVHDILNPSGGNLSYFRNENCVTPVIDPVGPLVICTGSSVTLQATETVDGIYTYAWNDGGGPVGGNTSSFVANAAGTYTVTVTDAGSGGSCSEVSAAVVVTIDAASGAAPIITSITNPCVGTDYQLTTSTVANGYEWTGPGGFTSTEQNPIISGIQPNQAGTYTLRARVGVNNCLTDETPIELAIQNVPQPVVVNTVGENFCAGTTINIDAPTYSGFTYSWNKDAVAIAGQTSTTLPVTETGGYSVVISDGTCSLESPVENITAVAAPVSTYTSVDAICVDLPISFTATSTGADGFTLAYAWAFNDAGASTAAIATPEFTYSAAGTFSASLTTSYVELTGCTNAVSKDITVQAVPVIAITAQDANGQDVVLPFEKCPSDELTLIMPSTLTNSVWTVMGATDQLSTENTYSTADANTYSYTGTDPVGCVITSEADVNNFVGSGLTVTSSSVIDAENVITLEDDQQSVDLTVAGGMDYTWEPMSLFDDPTASMVEIFPFDINTPVTVTGTDINDCVESATITIIDPFITPKSTFSPNNDGLGDDCWEIGNSSTLNGCSIVIFDSRGRRLIEVQSPFPEDCVWDGNFSGNPVPEGVYYYAMSCDDNQFNRSGSILLAR